MSMLMQSENVHNGHLKSDMQMIDQHAAHERVLLEELQQAVQKQAALLHYRTSQAGISPRGSTFMASSKKGSVVAFSLSGSTSKPSVTVMR